MLKGKNKIGSAAVAKLSYSSASRNSSEPISANFQINKLIKNVAKHSSYAYSSAIAKAKLEPLEELQTRVFRRLRPRYSADRFAELLIAVSAMPPLARFDWLRQAQRKLDDERH